MMGAESKDRTLEALRTIVESVEEKAQVPPDNPDVVALRQIVEHRIVELESDDGSEPVCGTHLL